MSSYFRELQKKPDHHKKSFALLASSTVMLFIFGIWALVNFPPSGPADSPTLASGSNVVEPSPFQTFRESLASSLEAIRNSFIELKSGVNININRDTIEGGYKELRNEALDTYDQ